MRVTDTRYAERTCACGVTFKPRQANHVHCSERCHRKARPPMRRSARPCAACGTPFHPVGYLTSTCSPECARLHRHEGASTPIVIRPCRRCTQPFLAHGRRLTCSPCSTNRSRFSSCRQCGRTFTDGIRRLYCDSTCRKASPKEAASRRLARDRRRARLRGLPAERVDRLAVYERDGWCCQLCGLSVDRNAAVPQPLAPTLDHIIPIAKGGPHTYTNVQLAHFACNSRKGDATGGRGGNPSDPPALDPGLSQLSPRGASGCPGEAAGGG